MAWGSVTEGRLGIGEPDTLLRLAGEEPVHAAPSLMERELIGGGCAVPMPVRLPPFCRVVQIACGAAHSGAGAVIAVPARPLVSSEPLAAAVTAAGEVYTWGCGDGGRLGLGHTRTVHTPTLVSSLRDAGVRVWQVACGRAHTLALSVCVPARGGDGEDDAGAPLLDDRRAQDELLASLDCEVTAPATHRDTARSTLPATARNATSLSTRRTDGGQLASRAGSTGRAVTRAGARVRP